MSNSCSVQGCENKHKARGWCRKHYLRWYKHGEITPDLLMPIGFTVKHFTEYRTWHLMRSRCSNPRVPAYKWYGEKGIKVCDRWTVGENGKHPFMCFFEDMGCRPDGKHSIDRVDSDKGYSPDNCRWANHKEQRNNQDRNHFIEFEGMRKTLKEWCEFLGVPYGAVSQRVNKYKYSFVKAVTTTRTEVKSRAATEMWAARRG